jgi:hypothetical protein
MMSRQYPSLLGGSTAPSPDIAVLVSILLFFVIDAAMIYYCLEDLNRRVIVTGGNKLIWAAFIVLGGPVGQIVYMLYGRGAY